MRMSRKRLEAKIEEQNQDIHILQLICKAYMRRHAQLEEEIVALNASLDATAASLERWQGIARKADQRRLEYVGRNQNA